MTTEERSALMLRLNAARRIVEYPTRHTRAQLDYAERQICELTPILFAEVQVELTQLGEKLRPVLAQISHGLTEFFIRYGPAFSEMHTKMVAAGLIEPLPVESEA